MEIFLYNGDESEFIKFPVIPKSIIVNSPQEIENFKTIGQGDINLTGLLGNRTLEISSFFPFREYGFSKDNTLKAMEYVDKIESWRALRKPLYITISNLNVSLRCVISKLDYGIKDGSGDIEYSLSITEFIRAEKYEKKTTKKIKTTTSDTATSFKDASYQNSDLIKNNIRSGPGLNYPKGITPQDINRIKVYSKFGGEWIKIKGGFILKKYLP